MRTGMMTCDFVQREYALLNQFPNMQYSSLYVLAEICKKKNKTVQVYFTIPFKNNKKTNHIKHNENSSPAAPLYTKKKDITLHTILSLFENPQKI